MKNSIQNIETRINTQKNISLFKRKGKIIIAQKIILEADESTLRAIFTNFFPIDVYRHPHQYEFWDSIVYYGVSPCFDELEEGCVIPEYTIFLESDKNGRTKFNRIEKRKL